MSDVILPSSGGLATVVVKLREGRSDEFEQEVIWNQMLWQEPLGRYSCLIGLLP